MAYELQRRLAQGGREGAHVLLGLVPDLGLTKASGRFVSQVSLQANPNRGEFVRNLIEDLCTNGIRGLTPEGEFRVAAEVVSKLVASDVSEDRVQARAWDLIEELLLASDFTSQGNFEAWIAASAKYRRGDVRALVRSNPDVAFAIVALPKEKSGLTDRGAADVLEALVGEFSDEAEVRGRINAAIKTKRQVELMQARGDLPSSAADVISPEVVISAIFEDLANEEWYEKLFTLRAWAMKLKDRADWQEILETEVDEGWTVFDHLVAAVFLCASGDENSFDGVPEIEPDRYDEVGLDRAVAEERLREMAHMRRLPRIKASELTKIRLRLAEKRKALEQAPRTLAEQTAAAADAVVEDDELF